MSLLSPGLIPETSLDDRKESVAPKPAAHLSHRELAQRKLEHGYISQEQFRVLEAQFFPPAREPEPIHPLVNDDVMLAAGIDYIPEPKPGEAPPAPPDPFAISPDRATSADIAAMVAALKTSIPSK